MNTECGRCGVDIKQGHSMRFRDDKWYCCDDLRCDHRRLILELGDTQETLERVMNENKKLKRENDKFLEMYQIINSCADLKCASCENCNDAAEIDWDTD